MSSSTCSSSDAEETRKCRFVDPLDKEPFDSPSGIRHWPYHDFCRCEASLVVKKAIQIAEGMLQAGCLPRATSRWPIESEGLDHWLSTNCQPKSHALDPPFHFRQNPGTQTLDYIPPKSFKERVLIPASREIAKNPLLTKEPPKSHKKPPSGPHFPIFDLCKY